MGMVICTFVTCPIGSCVGCGVAACSRICSKGDDDQAKRTRLLFLGVFSALFAAGCICYIALSIMCARADHDRWTLFRGEGECWSEGGSMPFTGLGWWTGALMGTGFFGTIVMLIRMQYDTERRSDVIGSFVPMEDSASVPLSAEAERIV